MDCVSHETKLWESRRELEQLYAAHTITVEAVGADHYHHVWVYTVSPRGKVLAESEVRVPMPNATQWGWPEPTPGRRLARISHTVTAEGRSGSVGAEFLPREQVEQEQAALRPCFGEARVAGTAA